MTLPVTLLGQADVLTFSQPLPLYSCAVRAGFPSPADDHLDTDLDLHRYVVKRPAATYFVRSEGDSMIGDGIHYWDLLMTTPRLRELSLDAFDQLNSVGITKLLCQDLKASMYITYKKKLISNQKTVHRKRF